VITNLYPEARSVGAWIREGWHVAVAYVIGFFVMLTLLGWHPHEPHKTVSQVVTGGLGTSPTIVGAWAEAGHER
jgi:hypothetical protein